MPRVMLLNGPNLNLLGRREPGIYGSATLTEIEQRLSALFAEAGVELVSRQTNHEGAMVDAIQECLEGFAGLIINPGGYTHTSVALRDALSMLQIPVIEVHLSKPSAREDFRQISLIRDAVAGSIEGFGALSYHLAAYAILSRLGFTLSLDHHS